MSQVVTHIATSDEKSVTVRGKDLCDEIIGERTFTEMIYFLSVGRMPSTAEARVLDACLVTLMEHGWVPTSIVTRLVADSVPDDVLSYRQNMTALIEGGKWNPWRRTWWGGTPEGWADTIHTTRSATNIDDPNSRPVKPSRLSNNS